MVKRRPPDLDHCVQVLLRLQNIASVQSPKILGEIYVCGLGLLYHLKLDRKTITEIRNTHDGEQPIPFPQPSVIPAISVVVHNQELFRALVSCLSSTAGEIESNESTTRGHAIPPGSRKRTASMDGDMPSSKSMKISHSPHISKRSVSYTRPKVNVKLLAATILFVAFDHLDHWPAAFMKAYADDCFGSRAWVDEAECRLFVENLELAHAPEEKDENAMDDGGKEADALIVAEFYGAETSGKKSPARRRGSLSSFASQNSSAIPQIGRARSMSTDSTEMFNHNYNSNDHVSSLSLARSQSTDNGNESDSGDEEEVAMATSNLTSGQDDGGSSSSGEEDEEVVISAKSVSGDDNSVVRSSPVSKTSEAPPRLEPSYPVVQRTMNFARVRQRYFGLNLEHAHRAVSSSLAQRLDIKTKQNSGLLQTLPRFAGIPEVRRLITANLEKWLQSPALAGLARSLFAQTVNMMKKTDPPLPADLDAIDNILSMRLKANQLNAHVENINSIAKRIPTAAVAHHVYKHLLREVLLAMDGIDFASGDHLRMIHAVHGVFPGSLSADGIAASLMNLLYDRPEQLRQMNTSTFVRRVCDLFRAVAKDLGGSFNGSRLLNSIACFQVPESVDWKKADEENRARLLFQCAILCIEEPLSLESKLQNVEQRTAGEDDNSTAALETALGSVRKVVLNWFCRNYSRFCSTKPPGVFENEKKGLEILGAGVPNYSSILDGADNYDCPNWLSVVRTVLFLEGPDSSRLRNFLFPNGLPNENSSDWREESTRIRLCYEFGGNVDDEMLWIVLRGATQDRSPTPPDVALSVLEHMFHGCKKDRKSSLSLSDPKILWELYRLVEFIPDTNSHARANDSTGDANDVAMNGVEMVVDKNAPNEMDGEPIPRLASPGLWWRATGLALVVCGASPDRIGYIGWNEHPTLKALIKMVTSDRYRFPTVDCDDAGRDEMKKTEQDMRDEEARITELLFLPPQKPKTKAKASENIESSFGGSRASRRQQEKRERVLKKQKEKQAHEALKEANRRKKMLRAAQKSIMLWDPKKGPRKPPKESADLIFSVGELFDLPRKFQRTVNPDFLLMTIGNTTRGAIERAYDWLIPIISVVPETIIRLPASASCFLLLRAYGTEGEERAQLQELSAPLLAHVRQSLTGSFGESDSVRAFDLLLTDVASHNADRRRCARRVLYEAIGKGLGGSLPAPFSSSNCGWMINLLHVRHSSLVVSDAIRHMSRAASFERGRVLRFLILALEKLSTYATKEKILDGYHFPSVLIDLVSSRPTVFASTMGSFPDLRSLAIGVVNGEFEKYTDFGKDKNGDVVSTETMKDACDIVLCCRPSGDDCDEAAKVKLPLALLESSCVLLSIWLENAKAAEDNRAVESLVRMLMRTNGNAGSEVRADDDDVNGLASARLSASGKSAIPVESWVMLARSRSDFIAKRAALTAPTGFLPRLLLCSGLPRASLLSMIDRLGQLGDKAQEVDKAFNQLMVPSATSEWDIGRLGRRREVSRKLLGRLSAYARMYQLSDLTGDEKVSVTFLEWLSKSCLDAEKPRKSKTKREKTTLPQILSKIEVCEHMLESVTEEPVNGRQKAAMTQLDGDASDMTRFLEHRDVPPKNQISTTGLDEISSFFETAFANDQVQLLEAWLEENFGKPPTPASVPTDSHSRLSKGMDGGDVSCLLLRSFSQVERKTEGLGTTIVKWVPWLSAASESPELWAVLLSDGQKPSFLWSNLISRCCQAWSHDHIVSCRDWILGQQEESSFDLAKTVRLLIQSLSWGSIDVEAFVGAPLSKRDRAWGFSEDSARKVIRIAIDSLLASSDDKALTNFQRRNNTPEGLVLLLLLSRLGRKQVQLVSQALVEQMGGVGTEDRSVLLACILRLYAYFPNQLNLGVAILRSALTEAVEKYSQDWLSWRSPMDDYFEDLIQTISYQGTPTRIVQVLAEGSKKHPLLVLRKLDRLVEILDEDATAHPTTAGNEKRGMVFGHSLNGPAVAKVGSDTVQVTIRHWGFNFTETVWTSFLEAISSVPKEVLFGCGLSMGLNKFLGVYMGLMSVQTQLRTSDRLSRLKGKLSEFLASFKASNKAGWDDWLGQEIPGLKSLGSARNVLLSCDFISHQEAIDSVKNSDGKP